MQSTVAAVLGGKSYSSAQAQSQVDQINKQTVGGLQRTSGNFKWAVSTVICEVSATGEDGLHVDNAALWDPKTDGCLVVKWGNRSLQAIVTVYALAI